MLAFSQKSDFFPLDTFLEAKYNIKRYRTSPALDTADQLLPSKFVLFLNVTINRQNLFVMLLPALDSVSIFFNVSLMGGDGGCF